MTALDAYFWFTEEDGVNHMHVGGFALVDGTAPTVEQVVDLLRDKLDMIPRYRQLPQPVPLHLGRPVWINAPEFRLEQHVSRVELARPGHDSLREQLEAFISSRLDRSRALWELLIIAGVEPNQWAVAWKIHHSMVDGVSGTELLTILFDTEPAPVRGAATDRWQPGMQIPTYKLLAGSLTGMVGELARKATGLRPSSLRKLGRIGLGGLSVTRRSLIPNVRSPLVGKIGPLRSFDWCAIPFDDIKRIRKAFGGTVNDVVLTVVVDGFRDLLLARNANVTGKSIRVMVPVALRERDAEGRPVGDGTMTTKASALLAQLPLNLEDPVERLKYVEKHLARLKQTRQAEWMTAINDVNTLLPGTVVALVVRGMGKVPQRSLHTTVTNVPGPPMQLYILGNPIRMIANYAPPFPVGARTSVTVYSYQGQLVFGITGDRASIPDVDVIAGGIRSGAARLVKAAGAGTRPEAK
jgi:WS/DGAT/MGAT family acyltransferase